MEPLTTLAAAIITIVIPVVGLLLVVPFILLEVLQWKRFFLSPKGRAIFITGCDSGFGKILANKFYNEGAIVYAGCLTPAGCTALEEECPDRSRLKTVVVDISDSKSVEKARDFLTAELQNTEEGLWALLNNAGITSGYYIELNPVQTYQRLMNVNFFGHIRVTQALLPLLRKGKEGRIINLGSIAGRLALPGMSAYASTKFAMEGWSDVLRREIAPFGIRVSIIEPWLCSTEIVKDAHDRVVNAFRSSSPEIQSAYGGEEFLRKSIEKAAAQRKVTEKPDRVIEVIGAAVFSRYPRARYSGNVIGQAIMIPLSWFAAEVQDFLLRAAKLI